MSKEKRIAAKAEKLLKEAEKRAVSVAKILANTKSPVSIAQNAPRKVPVDGAIIGGNFNYLVNISSAKEDRDGSWSWKIDRDWHKTPKKIEVETFLAEYDQVKTWRDVAEEKCAGKEEAVKKKHVFYPLSAIVKEAQDRIIDLKLDDYDEIFRFRLANKERLYGFVNGATFVTVWFDPTHEICPTD